MNTVEINRTIWELLGYETPYEQLPQDRAPLWATDTDLALELFKTLPPKTHVWWGQNWSIFNQRWEYFCHIEDRVNNVTYQLDSSESFAITLCRTWIKYKQAQP